MKLLVALSIVGLGTTWALPAQAETQAEPQAQDLLYAPCSNALIFNGAYCCSRGVLGTVSDCIPPILPLNDETFLGQCKLFQKEAVCCVSVLPILIPPGLCIPLPTLLVSSDSNVTEESG